MKFKPQKLQDLSSKMALESRKTVSQLIEINFLKSLPDYYIFFGRVVHFLYIIYHILCTLNF